MNRAFNAGRGAPVFKCDSCGVNTRLHSDCDGLCEDCYELGGIYNTMVDAGVDEIRPYAADIKLRHDRILAKGGTDSDGAEMLAALAGVPA